MLPKELQKRLERIARRPTVHLKKLYKITDPRDKNFGKVVYSYDFPGRQLRIDTLTHRKEPFVSTPVLHRVLEKSQRGRDEPASPLGLLGLINYSLKHYRDLVKKKSHTVNLFKRQKNARRKKEHKSILKYLWYLTKRYK